jgi:hypothetical protein
MAMFGAMVVACSEGTTTESSATVAGVWTATVGLVFPGDTLTLWVPDPPESGAVGFLRPAYSGSSDLSGNLHATATQLTGSLGQWPIGGIELSLELSGNRLHGTVQTGSRVVPVDFLRYRPAKSDVVGRWATTRVRGAPSGVFPIDTLRFMPDGRVRTYSTSLGCSVSGLRGVYARALDWLIIKYFWVFPVQPCSHLRLVDSLRVVGTSLVRTRSEFGVTIEETLQRR